MGYTCVSSLCNIKTVPSLFECVIHPVGVYRHYVNIKTTPSSFNCVIYVVSIIKERILKNRNQSLQKDDPRNFRRKQKAKQKDSMKIDGIILEIKNLWIFVYLNVSSLRFWNTRTLTILLEQFRVSGPRMGSMTKSCNPTLVPAINLKIGGSTLKKYLMWKSSYHCH